MKLQLREERKAKAAISKEAGKIFLWHFEESGKMNMCSPEWLGTLWWAAGRKAKWHLWLVLHSQIPPSIQNRTQSSLRHKLTIDLKLALCFFSGSYYCFVQYVPGPCNARSKHLITYSCQSQKAVQNNSYCCDFGQRTHLFRRSFLW